MKKKNFKLGKMILALASAALIASGCASMNTNTSSQSGEENQDAQNQELTKIVVSEFRGINYAAVHIAKELGYFEEEGLDVEFAVYGDGPVAFQGMHAGDSQFCLLSIEPVFRATEEGLESYVLGALDTTRLYGFVGSKDITEISQLRGKTVFAGAPGSAPYSFVWSLLEDGGLNPAEDVTFAQMQYGASIAALEQGTIDASYMDHYNRNKFAAIGANFLVDGADMETKKKVFGSERFEGSIITATKAFVDENPETVQRFINAAVKGAQWVTTHSAEEVVEVLLPYHDGSSKEDLLERIELIQFAYSPDLRITKEGYEAMEKFALKTGVLKNEVGYDNIIDMEFVENANQ